ncbi:hypothetical protein Saa2_06599 [Streptomyces acidiscabies]|nr:hypothetical protein Saa2_06599 [Streptomyces acidiscabies]
MIALVAAGGPLALTTAVVLTYRVITGWGPSTAVGVRRRPALGGGP